MKKLNFTLVAGLIAAVLGASMVLAYGRGVEKRIAAGRETVTVLVASSPLEAGMGADDLRKSVEAKEIPTEYVAEGALDSTEDLGRGVLSSAVGAGAQLTPDMFVLPESADTLKASDGHVALAIGVDISPGVARYLAPGSVVDLFVTYRNVSRTGAADEVEPGGGATNRTKLFVSGVRVLSVSLAPIEQTNEDDASGSPAGATDAVIAVLDVTAADAERIVNAVTLGEIYIALSSSGDMHRTPTGVVPEDVVSSNGGGA